MATCTAPDTPEGPKGLVTGITDGDTVTILIEQQPVKVRLAEIDTPERGQSWASRAKQALSDKVFDKEVTLRVVDTDRYGRTVGHVYRGERHINREMVREGHAWAFRKYLLDESLLDDEDLAREERRGIWSLPEARQKPPWEWRAALRAMPASRHAEAFTCDTKRYCREMASCEEAIFYLEECGLARLDGDGDGVPCEMLCR